MSKKLCVYTCITGDYDNLHEIEVLEKNVDYLCFTNNKNLKSATWQIIYIDNEGLDNHHLSRKIKMLGHPLISKNYDISVWMDASVVWQKKVTDFVKSYLKDKPFAAFKHSQRNSIHDEAIACLKFRKDTKENILNILSFLETEHFPDNLGLYEMTVFIKKHNDPKVIETMRLWFNINQKYSKRDQLSFMYAIWKTNLKISTITLNIWDNPWFFTIKHNHNPKINECHIYYGNPNLDFDFNKYYIYKYHKTNDYYKIESIIPNNASEIEINLTNALGVNYSEINFCPKYNHMMTIGSINYNGNSAFCIGYSIIKFYGNFKKNQKISFSIKMQVMNQAQLQELAESLWVQNDKFISQNKYLESEIRSLHKNNNELESQLQDILSSKAWNLIQKIRKIIHPFK